MVTTKRPIVLLVLGLGCLAAPASCQTYAQLDAATVRKLQLIIEGKLNTTGVVNNPDGTVRMPLIPAFVRLAFHDCCSPGGCDGCVNLATPTTVPDNNGRRPAVDALEALYTTTTTTLNIKSTISRADFWALAGPTAANYAARMQRVREEEGGSGPCRCCQPVQHSDTLCNALLTLHALNGFLVLQSLLQCGRVI